MKIYSLFLKAAKWTRKQREVSGKSKVGTLSIEPAIGKGSNLWYFCGKQRVEKVIRVPCNQRVGESFAREPVG
jgi:hypothetical protein